MILNPESSRNCRWRCNRRDTTRSVRCDSWLDYSKLPLVTIIHFVYLWSKWELTTIDICGEELGLVRQTIVSWNCALRELCFWELRSRSSVKILGPGEIVEIDESMFSKAKNHVGRMFPQTWVFGGVCRSTKECFVMRVPHREASTLLRAIEANIAPGTIMYLLRFLGRIQN